MYANPLEFEFQWTIFKFRKRNKISSLTVYVQSMKVMLHDLDVTMLVAVLGSQRGAWSGAKRSDPPFIRRLCNLW